jgi:omega-amidase
MQNSLHITCVQFDVLWGNITGNLSKINLLIEGLKTDLIILPEMFSSGFSTQPENFAEAMNGVSVSWMKKIATERDSAIMGSLIIKEATNYFNRLVFVHPSGDVEFYNKRHLFSLAGEDKVYESGEEKLIIEYLGWKICPMICYDLRFPVWSRNTEDYDVLIYVANWPRPRINAWDTLLKARAIENMSYVVGVNRVGKDANNLTYIGHTQGVDMLGELLSSHNKENEGIVALLLDKPKLDFARSKFQFLNDKDSFSIKK